MRIALLGDLGFFGKYSLKNNKNLFDYFKEISEVLKECDLVVGNLETPFCENLEQNGIKSAYISSEYINVELLKFLNISIVNLSNNHLYDYGDEGCRKTQSLLSQNNIEYFGIDNEQLLKRYAENKIAFSGYCCYSTNSLGYYNSKKGRGVNILSGEKIEDELVINNRNGFLNIASIHCGEEHINYPNYDHIELARKLAEKIPYVFYGHHPHVIQGIEKYKDSLIAYSLGNFCFDDIYTPKSKEAVIKQSINNKESFVMVLEVENSKLKNYKILPISCDDEKMRIGNQLILEKIKKYSKELLLKKSEYVEKRSIFLKEYYEKRKQKRDLKWYVKRLNYKSLYLIYDLIKNRREYKKNIKKYIES